jgi:hypothetical protein
MNKSLVTPVFEILAAILQTTEQVRHIEDRHINKALSEFHVTGTDNINIHVEKVERTNTFIGFREA